MDYSPVLVTKGTVLAATGNNLSGRCELRSPRLVDALFLAWGCKRRANTGPPSHSRTPEQSSSRQLVDPSWGRSGRAAVEQAQMCVSRWAAATLQTQREKWANAVGLLKVTLAKRRGRISLAPPSQTGPNLIWLSLALFRSLSLAFYASPCAICIIWTLPHTHTHTEGLAGICHVHLKWLDSDLHSWSNIVDYITYF